MKENIDSYIQICAMVGKFGIAGSFALIYNYTAELYPVVVRSNGVGIGSIAGRVGGILFPFVLDLKGKVNNGHGEYLPMAIFGSLAIGKSNFQQVASSLSKNRFFNEFFSGNISIMSFPWHNRNKKSYNNWRSYQILCWRARWRGWRRRKY